MPTTTAPQSDTIRGPLALGSTGTDVRTLQSLLNQQSNPRPGLAADGVFGIKTDAAVRDFQKQKGLKADGIVGPNTCKALGVKFVSQPPPAPLPSAPGARPSAATTGPQAILFSVIAIGLRNAFKAVEREIRNQPETDDNTRALDRAVKFAKSGLSQAVVLLTGAVPDVVDAQFAASQVRTALTLVFSGFVQAATQVQVAGGDGSGILEIASELNAVSARIVSVVSGTLQGNIARGIDAGARELRALLAPLAE